MRNEVEGVFGSGMRKNSLDLIMARWFICADTSITMAFFVMFTEKIRKLLRPFFVIISAWFLPGNGQAASGWSPGTFGSLKWLIHWSLYENT
jgi:hypothetical protein